MSYLPSRRRIAQVALPAMICAALAAGAARAGSGATDTSDDAMPLSVAQADQPPAGAPPRPGDMPPDAPAGHGPMPRGDMHHGGWEMEHRSAWAAKRRLRLADRLATMRVYLDITLQQEDAWHAFSQAVLAMVPDPKETMHDGAHPMGAFDGIDRMAKMLQRRADAARVVNEAAQKLKAGLTGAQIEKADAVWAAMREHWMHRGWHHHHERHGRDDDDDRR